MEKYVIIIEIFGILFILYFNFLLLLKILF
jgi:hypothetical protein